MDTSKLPCPIRVRIRRSGGQIVQGCDVYIGRRFTMGGWNLPESIWANPFKIKDFHGNRNEVIRLYWNHLASRPDLLSRLSELSGKTIGCFCELNEQCHGDVIIHAGRYIGIW